MTAADCPTGNSLLKIPDQATNACTSIAPVAQPQPLLLSNLQVLSLVSCQQLTSFCLGLQPQQPLEVWTARQYLSFTQEKATEAAKALSWAAPKTPALPMLRVLRLGLSSIQVLALALPSLTHLELASCTRLRALELRCPSLTSINAQACSALPLACLEACFTNLPPLQVLNVQHAPNLVHLQLPLLAVPTSP